MIKYANKSKRLRKMFGLRGKIDKAIALYESGDYAKSLKLCRDILKSDSSNASIWVTAGNVYYVNKKFEEAIKYYREAVKHVPENFSAWINWANCCCELKKYKELNLNTYFTFSPEEIICPNKNCK